ncbi:TraU protein [Pseudomonas syringae pv. maculicola]|nr:TraU protein [Pseudomonas syringae pv. maculicola]
MRQKQAGEVDSNNVIRTLANELIKRRGYNL